MVAGGVSPWPVPTAPGQGYGPPPSDSGPKRGDWLSRFADSWRPEVTGVLLALATVLFLVPVARAANHAVSMRAEAFAVAPSGLSAVPSTRGWLDIEVVDDGQPGAQVTWVDPNGPSASQLRQCDVISAIDGHQTSSVQALTGYLDLRSPGSEVRLSVVRGDATRVVGIRLAPKPPAQPVAVAVPWSC